MQRIPRRRFTDEFTFQAVALAEFICPAKATRQLDMSVKTLANWLDTARSGKPLSAPSRAPVSELESELARLRAEAVGLSVQTRQVLGCSRAEPMPDKLVERAFLNA